MADITTNPVTLQGLSDIISAMQREINDLSVIIMGHTTELETHEGEINTLQDPPTGVPIPLIEWYGLGHSTKEVDTILANDLTTLSTASDGNSESVALVSDKLDQEISDRATADADLQATDADLQSQITTNLDTLTQEVADRSALSVTVSDQYDSANVRFDNIESDVAGLATSGANAASSASAQISTINQSLQVAQTQILQLQGIGVDPAGAQASQITALTIIANDAAADVAQETIDRTNADAQLQASINTLNSSISGIQSGLDSEVSARESKDAELETEIGAIEAEVAGTSGLISAETAARVAGDAAIQTDTDQNTADISDLETATATETADRIAADTALQGQVTTNGTNVAANTAQIATNSAAITQIKGQFGVVKDVGGYVTDWQALDQLTAPGDFKLKDLNNNIRLYTPGYPAKYFIPVSAPTYVPVSPFDADWGGGTSSFFNGGDHNDYTRQVRVASALSTGVSGSVFMGNDFGTGGDPVRLGQVVTIFNVDFGGYVNGYLSVWYRIKATVNSTAERWFPVAQVFNDLPGARTYEYVRSQKTLTISCPVDKVIEFGLTVLNTNDATISNAAQDQIYGASMTVVAYNMMTFA